MNNDTPQVFGEDTYDFRHDPGPVLNQGDEDFRAFRGWGERVEPVAPDDAYPQPSLAGYEPDLGYPHEPQAGAGYPPDRGYAVDHAYAMDRGYAVDHGFAEDPGYPGDAGFWREAEPVPVMEPLPGPGDQPARPAPVP